MLGDKREHSERTASVNGNIFADGYAATVQSAYSQAVLRGRHPVSRPLHKRRQEDGPGRTVRTGDESERAESDTDSCMHSGVHSMFTFGCALKVESNITQLPQVSQLSSDRSDEVSSDHW